ncbi:MAG: exo-alpha-sialidase [Ectothiorhodospiraceae bacterium]|nr:exo-alpha-sialidase [Ectothiorhodospiraceae bacterium]
MSDRVSGRGMSAPGAVLRASAFAVLAFCPVSPIGAETIDWQDPLEVASGEAHMGQWRMNESDFRYVDDPSVALDGEGVATVVWVDQARQDVFLQRYDASGDALLDEPVNVSRSGDTFSWLPRVITAAGDADTVYVLWQEILFSGGSHGGEILFARSDDAGRSFSEPQNLSNTDHGAGKGRLTAQRWDNGSLDLAEGPDGTLWAVWTEYEGRLSVSHSSDGGHAFSSPHHVAGLQGEPPARAPSVAVGADGRVHLAWTVGEDMAADIHYAVSEDGGESFGTPVKVIASDGHSDAPVLAVDDENRIHLAYAESPDGLWQRAHIRYTRAGEDGEFSPPRELGASQQNGQDSLGFPALAVAGDAVYVLWERFPSLDERSRGLGLAWSGDGGERFVSSQTVPGVGDTGPGFNGSLQGLLMRKLAVNESGDIAVVNSTFHQGESSVVRLIRGGISASLKDSTGEQ